ncbi:DUF3055 domain-containing protein [Alicyclobacillus kakegawensis]|uniref:DUF3055 domain-containing protein n=1 Tax=Alicyclobacillus kakegawensis TaxID=392012 RepID=UPI000A9CD97E
MLDSGMVLYDETEATTTRYVGVVGQYERYDLAITSTGHFYGKSLVTSISSGRTAILGTDDLVNIPYLMQVFALTDERAAQELSELLQENI